MSQIRVEFRTYDGVVLRGDYYPTQVENAPIIIMTQGLTLLKECYIDDTARRFQTEGVAALVYDHRGWGSSEGTPFQETNPSQQAEDYHDAVTFARTLSPAIDSTRVAIWGIGHSGGASMIAAGDDLRIKAAIFNMPFTSGAKDATSFPPGGLEAIIPDRELHTSASNVNRTYIPVWDDSLEQAKSEAGLDSNGKAAWLHGEGLYAFITGGIARSRAAGTLWRTASLYRVYIISIASNPKIISTRSRPQDRFCIWLLRPIS